MVGRGALLVFSASFFFWGYDGRWLGAGRGWIGGKFLTIWILFLGGIFSPASGLLAGRSRPGANIEARPRFNPRSGWYWLFSSFLVWVLLFFFFGTVDDGWARGAFIFLCCGFSSCFFRLGWGIIFFFFSILFFSGQVANHIVGISYYRILGDCVKIRDLFWWCVMDICLILFGIVALFERM